MQVLHEAHGGRGGCLTRPQQRGSRQESNIFHESLAAGCVGVEQSLCLALAACPAAVTLVLKNSRTRREMQQ